MRSEMGKIELLKIVGNLLVKHRKLYMNGTVILMSSLKKNPGNFCFSKQIFHRKQSLGASECTTLLVSQIE